MSKGICFTCGGDQCNKFFHPLCAYFVGLYFNFIDDKPKIKEKGSKFTINVKIFCNEHSPIKDVK